ncbi:MAG: YqgE/AlgH family protein [Sandaracinaceae bacterium]|nr:YqgE/AlgH family protein [Sandaracinaceae bacterium]
MRAKAEQHPGGSARLAPGFVVAAPSLRDPNFARSVVLLVEHGTQGSIGFVVNRLAPVAFKDVAESIGVEADVDMPVLVGGPVSRTGWVVFDPTEADEALLEDAVRVHERIAVTASRKALEALGEPTSSKRRLLVVGYAGWGQGQLDGELERGVWLPVALDPSIVFDCAMEQRWAEVLRGAGIEPGRIISNSSGLVS